MFRDLWEFTSSVVSYWQAYATGGVVTALINIAERLSGWTLSKKVYVRIFVVVYLLAAFFLVWRTEHRQVVTLSSREVQLSGENISLETRLRQAETAIRDLTVKLTTALSVNYSPSLDVIYAEKQFRFYNRGRSNLYLWGTRFGDDKRSIESEPRLISPAGGGLIGQGFYYILGDAFETVVREKLGNDGEMRAPFEVFVAAEDGKRYRIRYILWTVLKAGTITVHAQNMGFTELDWTKN